MAALFKGLTRNWIWRGAAVLLLVLASFQVAAADNSAASITLFAPGAPTGAVSIVQFQSPSGEWFDVTGWQATLNQMTGTDVPYVVWTVDKDNFGQGPFRWVVYQPDGKTFWAISDIFNLPPGGGMNQSVTIRTDNLVVAPTTAVEKAVVEAAAVPVLKGGSTTWGVSCTSCQPHAQITAYITGVPANSWLAVQWLDGLGNWQIVSGWQGNANFLFSKGDLNDWTPGGIGTLYQQWSVLPGIYGTGPYRWAVYDGPNGTLLAVSPNFNLPTMDGANQVMFLSK